MQFKMTHESPRGTQTCFYNMSTADRAIEQARWYWQLPQDAQITAEIVPTDAGSLLDAALLKVQSPSIPGWVNKQRGIWLKIAQHAFEKNTTPELFAAYIVCTALG